MTYIGLISATVLVLVPLWALVSSLERIGARLAEIRDELKRRSP